MSPNSEIPTKHITVTTVTISTRERAVRILHVDDQFIPSLGYQSELARVQQEMGHDVHFAASVDLPPEKALSEQDRGDSTVPHDLLWTARVGGRNVWMPGLWRVLRRVRPEVVHYHGVFDLTAVMLAVLKPMLGYRLFYCSHTSALNTHVDYSTAVRVAYGLFRATGARVIRRAADGITAVGENERSMLSRWLSIPEDEIQIIRLGATSESESRAQTNERDDIRSSHSIGADDILVVTVGTVTPSKGIDILIDAVAMASDSGVPIKAMVVGGGDQEFLSQLRHRAEEKGVSERISIPGKFVPKSEVAEAFRAADIACWPNNISIASVEAMAAGLPLVVRDGDLYRRELVSEDNGVLVKGDAKSVFDALASLAADPAMRSRMGDRSKAAAIRDYTWEGVARQFLGLYSAV